MGGSGQYTLHTLTAQQYRGCMHQVIKIIPTWQYTLQWAKAYHCIFCEMVHPSLWHALAALLSVQGLELAAEHLDEGMLASAPVCNKASLHMAKLIWLGVVAHAPWVTIRSFAWRTACDFANLALVGHCAAPVRGCLVLASQQPVLKLFCPLASQGAQPADKLAIPTQRQSFAA